jgi:WD40 repeat protein
LEYGSPSVYSGDLTKMLGISGTVVNVWTPVSGRSLATLSQHTGKVNGLAISADRTLSASASSDGTVRLWDLSRMAQTQCFRVNTSPVNCVVFSPDGSRLFSAGDEQSIRIWDFTRPQTVADFAPRLERAHRMLAHGGDDADSIVTLGEWYAFRGLDDWAVELLEQARAQGAKVPALTLARAYWRMDQNDKARRAFAEAIRSNEAPESYLRQCFGAVTPAPAVGLR